MVNVFDLIEYLKEIAPASLAESYDNVGLLVDSDKPEISKVLLTLDTDSAVAIEAKDKNCDMIISHHPLIFNPVKNITKETDIGKSIRFLIKNDIGLYAMHTNFDSVKGGLCDYLVEKIFGNINTDCLNSEEESGIGRVFSLDTEVSLADLIKKVKMALNLSSIRFVGDDNKMIKKVCVVGGGGGSMTDDVISLKADAYISGDFKYQHGRDAYFSGMSLIEISHYDAEIIFCEYLKEKLLSKFGDMLSIEISEQSTNVWRSLWN